MDRPPTIEADVKVVGFVGRIEKLLIVTGDAGNFWSKGANLGTHSARVTVNAVEVICLLPSRERAQRNWAAHGDYHKHDECNPLELHDTSVAKFGWESLPV